MNGREGTVVLVICLPFPWPPAESCLLFGGESNGQLIELTALTDGRLAVTIQPPKLSFLSQPIDINSSKPRFVLVTAKWTPREISVEVLGQQLLPYTTDGPVLTLPAQASVPDEISLYDPNASAACETWIQNRKSKFGQPPRSEMIAV